jgi:hypothetical protein
MPKAYNASGLAKMFWFFLLLLIPTSRAGAADVTLARGPNTETDLPGYRIYRGTSSGVYLTPIDVGLRTTYTIAGL